MQKRSHSLMSRSIGAIEIKKLDKKTGENVQGIATLAGAQFTVNYYAGDYTLGKPAWQPDPDHKVIQTKENSEWKGPIRHRSYG